MHANFGKAECAKTCKISNEKRGGTVTVVKKETKCGLLKTEGEASECRYALMIIVLHNPIRRCK